MSRRLLWLLCISVFLLSYKWNFLVYRLCAIVFGSVYVYLRFFHGKSLIRAEAENAKVTITCFSSIFYKDYKLYYKPTNERDKPPTQLLLSTSHYGEFSGILTQLINGMSYSFSLTARHRWMNWERQIAQIQASPRLDPPAYFKAAAGCVSATITLSWLLVFNATGYEIERASHVSGIGKNFTKIVTISSDQSTTYADSSRLVNGKTYYYKIAAVDSRSRSVFSSIVSATPQLTRPSSFTAVADLESTAFILSWETVADATGYKIERALDTYGVSEFVPIVIISNGRTTTYTDKFNLINGTTYNYRIVAIENQVTSAFSSIISTMPHFAAPLNFRAIVNQDTTTVTLLWSPVVTATGYRIERASDNSDASTFNTIATVSDSQMTMYDDKSDLQNGKTYHYRIATVFNRSRKKFWSWSLWSDTSLISPFSPVIEVTLPLVRSDNFNIMNRLYADFFHILVRNLIFGSGLLNYNGLPSNWEQSNTSNQICLTVSKTSAEYKSIIDQFKATIKPYAPTIVCLERIQNEKWFKQYKAHEEDFRKRLNKDTARTLYHGCSKAAAISIISEGFNLSFAGTNGSAYGVGRYFATDANYSHSYTSVNSDGQRCMFVAKVLIGNSTSGNSSMTVCPIGYDSTTNGSNIFVAYDDAQSYGEYLITYK